MAIYQYVTSPVAFLLVILMVTNITKQITMSTENCQKLISFRNYVLITAKTARTTPRRGCFRHTQVAGFHDLKLRV